MIQLENPEVCDFARNLPGPEIDQNAIDAKIGIMQEALN